jgi:hypothetical protein
MPKNKAKALSKASQSKTLTLTDLENLGPVAPGDPFSVANEHHHLARLSMAQSCAHMVLAGVELRAAKKDVKHGEWTNLFIDADHKNARACAFEMSIRTAQKYMEMADAAKRNIPELRTLNGEQSLADLPKEQQEKIVKAICKVADGSTYQQLALEWGIAKKPRGAGARGGHRPGAGDDGTLEGDTPEEQAAIGIWKPMIHDLEHEGLTEKSWANLPDKYREKLNGVLVDLKKLISGK